MTKYAIRKTPLGYIPTVREGILSGWSAIRKDGTSGVAFKDAPSFPYYFHKTKADAGACIDAHAAYNGSPAIWSGKA